MERQSIPNRYIKLGELRSLLLTKFGTGNFTIQEGDETYEIQVPRQLTEVMTDSVQLSETQSTHPAQTEIESVQTKYPDTYHMVCHQLKMGDLRVSIDHIRFRNKNIERRYFIPEESLFKIFSEATVKNSLQSLTVPIHEIKDLTDSILKGARKCFAILLSIDRGADISAFFRYDSLQQSCPDDRLPYTSESLEHILEEEATSPAVQRFLEKQWEFAVPIMHQHMIFRKLDAEVILPIVHEEPVGRGSMGSAWRVELHPECHQLPVTNHTVIRKQIECAKGHDMSTFRKELENLSLLAHLKHPNIVQLYCSYIYRQRYSFIFAVADGGTLADFLNRDLSSNAPRGSQTLLALADLASAIDALHNFTSEALDLSLSGCHHDLAPRNILVHGDTFLLADFGLSSLKNSEQDSLTPFREVRGSYVAPECQTIHEGNVQSAKVCRASDIWSFGCILSEVLTHILFGRPGVEQFRDKRKVTVTPEITWFRFHRGPGNTSSEVNTWLDNLQSNGEPFHARLVDLIREMLSMDPSQRPRSARVLAALRGVSALSLAAPVIQVLNRRLAAWKSTDRVLDTIRFQSWLSAFNQLLDGTTGYEPERPSFAFSTMVEALKEIYLILEESEGNSAGIRHQQRSLLQYQHRRLLEALPTYFRSLANDELVRRVLQIDDPRQMNKMSTEVSTSGDEDIGVLLAVRHITALAETGRLVEKEELALDAKDVSLKQDVDVHSIALLKPTSEVVIVEWLRYEAAWADRHIGNELRRRLASVASLLSDKSTAQIPGSLKCRGIFHNSSQRAFGVAYGLPSLKAQPKTLHGLLSAPKNPYRPMLEHRFRLAFDLCRCIHTFHKVGWLHRNLHSMNVLFFPHEATSNADWAKDPRILGFARSRQTWIDAFTDGPNDIDQRWKYQHPKYLVEGERYREEFDYYSVGMLLLEIGLWSTLSKLTDSDRFKNLSHEEFRREVLATRIPQLGIAMGGRYMQAARMCLEGGFSTRSDDSRGEEDIWSASFEIRVMNQIPLID